MANWWDEYEQGGKPAQAPAKSPWRQFIDTITNRDWGQTADYISSAAEQGAANVAGMVEGTLNNPLVTRTMPADLSDIVGAITNQKTPLTNKIRQQIPQPEPQDKGDIYAGRAVEGGVSGLPFGGIGALSGASSGLGGQIGRDITGSDLGDLAGQVIGGVAPFAPRGIASIRAGRAIRAGAANPDFDRAIQITMGTESGFDPAAVSPKGARGLMQVMPDTAKDPGHGIRPSNGTAADDVRVGKQLFASLLNKYDHDFGKAWGAYNWGEGRVDTAIKAHGDNWLAHTPPETQNYVLKNMSELVGGKYTGPAGPDGLPTNGAVPPIEPQNIANIMQDQEMLAALDKQGKEPDWTDPTLFNNEPEYYQTDIEGNKWAADGSQPLTETDNVVPFPEPDFNKAHRDVHDYISGLEDEVSAGNPNGLTPQDIADARQGLDLDTLMQDLRDKGMTNGSLERLQSYADRLDELYRKVGQDSSHEKYTGYPAENGAANVNEPAEPIPGRPAVGYTDAEWKQLSPADRARLVKEGADRAIEPVERDQNPPASSGTFGTRPPEGINRRPPTKSPEGHGAEDDIRSIEVNTNKRGVLNKLHSALKQVAPMRQEAADMLTRERARRAAAGYRIRSEDSSEAGLLKELSALKGSIGRPKIESIRHLFTQPEIDQMHRIINDSSLPYYETINARVALKKLLGADYGEIPTESEARLLQKALPTKGNIWLELAKNEEGSLHLPEGAMKVADVANFARTMRSSFDLSAPFRQGVFMVGSKAFWKNIPEMVKMFKNKEFFEQEMRNMRLDPLYHQATDDGLALTDTHGILQDREEAFMSRLAGKVPGVKMSERAYTGYLNKLRFDTYKNYAQLAEKGNIPFKGRDAARFINSATGRGDLGALGNAATPLLGGGFFSPRLIASRVNLLNPYFYVKLDPFVRVQAMKSLLSFTGIAAMSLGLLKAAGAKVDTDWRHPGPDFGKAVFGDTRVDVLGGFQQYIRFGLELATGMKKSQSGNVKEINAEKAGPYDPTYLSETGRFARSKLAPVPAALVNYMDGKKDFLGRPMTVTGTLKDLFLPMASEDIWNAYQEYGGVGAAAVAAPTILGVGVNTYQPNPAKDKSNFGFKDPFKNEFGKQFGTQFPKEFK